MNLRQRGSRYGFTLNFAVGATAVVILAASFLVENGPEIELALAAALVAVLILHARLGFAFGKAQAEIEMLRRQSKRIVGEKAHAPSLEARIPANDAVSAEDARTLQRVQEAVDAERIELYLQPIVSLPQRKGRFFEAFSRLRDADGRVLRPIEYVEAAERANRIGAIDNAILVRCIQAVRRRCEIEPRLGFFCNLSPATIYDTDFFNALTDYLEANADLASNIVFEFTYPAVQTMHPRVEENLQAIARKGFVFSIDHVHTLDVDWRRLRERNFHYVKASASLLLAASRGDEASAARLRDFRKRLSDAGIDLIAEKIELESHMPEILALGIDYGQGDLFGPARPAEIYLGAAAAPAEPAPPVIGFPDRRVAHA